MKIYRYKMYDKAKRGRLDKAITRFGYVRNYAVKMTEYYFKYFGKSLSAYQLSNHIAKKKRRDCATGRLVAGLDAQAVQECLGRVYKGFKAYFAACKKKRSGKDAENKRVRKPHERKPWKNRSFTLLQCGYKFDEEKNRVRIGGAWYGFFKSQELKGKVKRITIKRDWCGDMWLVVLTDRNEPVEGSRTGKAAGFDFGLKTFLTGSDGYDILNPQFLKRNMKKLAKSQKHLSQAQKGSKHRRRARLAVAKMHRRIENCRNDWQWKVALELVRRYDAIFLETLSIAGMQRHKNWGQKVSDLAYSSFLSKLESLAMKHGKLVVYIDRWMPTSQICHKCGEKASLTKDLKIREWACPHCGAHHDRDRNAAINILRVGMSTLGRDSVRRLSAREAA